MARKGEKKGEKRLTASKAVKLLRKERTWTIRSKPGPHNRQNSIPLGFVVRDLLHLAKTRREAKYILNQGLVEVDAKVAKDARFPVGLFDLIAIKREGKTFRVLFNKKGQLVLQEEKKQEKEKLCKVVAKNAAKKGLIQLQTNDGRTFREKKTDVKVGDSLLVKLPEQKIAKHFSLAEGNRVLVTGGHNIGSLGSVKKITAGTMRRPKLITVQGETKAFQTTEKNVFVVGEKKPAIEVKG